jgi:uncharacterized protein YqhQ
MAVIEGVLMRGPERWAVAVRRPDGSIAVDSGEAPEWSQRWAQVPFARGIAALADSLSLGVRALGWSTEVSGKAEPGRKLRVVPTAALAVVLAAGLFFVLPAATARLLVGAGAATGWVEAGVRLSVFVGYLALVGRLPDIARVFAYHGAEHMAVSAHESGGALDVASARRYGTRHPRCGTTFMLVVVFGAACVTVMLGELPWAKLIASRLLLVPVMASVAYELLRLAATRLDRPVVRWLLAPGLALQSLTTRPPDDDQLEVALVALRTALAPAPSVAVVPMPAAASVAPTLVLAAENA